MECAGHVPVKMSILMGMRRVFRVWQAKMDYVEGLWKLKVEQWTSKD